MRNVFGMTLRQGYTRTHTLSFDCSTLLTVPAHKMNGILCGVVFRMTYDFYMFWNEKVRCHRSRIFIFFFFALHTFSTSLTLCRQYKIRYGCNEMVLEISLGFFFVWCPSQTWIYVNIYCSEKNFVYCKKSAVNVLL